MFGQIKKRLILGICSSRKNTSGCQALISQIKVLTTQGLQLKLKVADATNSALTQILKKKRKKETMLFHKTPTVYETRRLQ